MDKKDILLIYLRNNARETLTSVSKATKIPISTLYDRLKGYEKTVIRKHTTLVDFTKLGYNCIAHIILKVQREQREALRQVLINNPCVNSVFKVNNGYDFLVEGIFHQVRDMEDFLDYLEAKFQILDRQTYFIIEDIKREKFLSNPDLVI